MAVLFDLDGVFYRGDKAIAGGADTAHWARENDVSHLYLTNTTSRPRSALVEKLASFDVETDESHIFTPPVATVRWCRDNLDKGKIALFVPEATRSEFSALPLWQEGDEDVAAVIVGDLGKDWDFSILNHAFQLLMLESRPRLIALGMTRYWQAGDGLRLDVAPFVMALSHAADTEPLVLGKPAKSFYRTAVDILGVRADEVVMVGDDIRGDVDGAQQAGIRGVLVRTGKFREEDLELEIEPAGVLKSIADFPEWYEEEMKNEK